MNYTAFIATIISMTCLSQAYSETGDSLTVKEEISISSENPLLDLERELLSLEEELLDSEVSFVDTLESSTPVEFENIEETPIAELESSLTVDEAEETPILLQQEESTAPLFFENVEHTPQIELEASISTDAAEPALTQEITAVSSEITPVEAEASALPVKSKIEVSFKQVFEGAPLIYSLLLAMSFTSLAVCLYSVLRMKQQNTELTQSSKEIRTKLLSNNFLGASNFCQSNPNLLNRIISSGLACRKHGLNAVLENMKSEGKRATLSAWQRLGILQDIAVIAPMIGLLGTVIGLFYAFYDLNRSFNSIDNLLDGLGISVGTTVAGIGVAILSMILHSGAKFKLVRTLARVETEATSLAHLMDEKN